MSDGEVPESLDVVRQAFIQVGEAIQGVKEAIGREIMALGEGKNSEGKDYEY